jgi:hypothetical protein
VSDDAPLDIVVPRAPTDDGKGLKVVRLREREIGLGELRPLEDGKPIAPTSEIVQLARRDDLPAWDVKVLVERSGPAQVATAAYRDHWDATFGDDDTDN